MESEYLLSICIPTFNRAEYLDINLKYLSQQKDISKVQIVIADNNSKDSTSVIVKNYKHLNIKYIKHKCNIGFQRNFESLIDISDGKFTWFMGDDDIITQNSITLVLKVLEKNSEIGFLCVDHSPYQGVSSFIESHNKDKVYKRGKELFYQLHVYFQFLSISIVNTLRFKQSIVRHQNVFLQERHIFQIMDVLSNSSAYFLNQKIVLSGYMDHNIKRASYDKKNYLDNKDASPLTMNWLDIFFRIPNMHIKHGIESFYYDDKLLSKYKKDQDKRLILMYLSNKKNGDKEEYMNNSLKDIFTILHFNSSRFFFLTSYLIPEKIVPLAWSTYKLFERFVKR